MASASKRVRFGEFEIVLYDVVKVKVSCKRAQPHAPDGGDEDVDDDRMAREEQRNLSKRSHCILALGRAAELRASVEKYLQEPSTQLPDVVAWRSRQASGVPKSKASSLRRPAPRSRQKSTSAVDAHNTSGMTPVPHADADLGDVQASVTNDLSGSVASSLDGGADVDLAERVGEHCSFKCNDSMSESMLMMECTSEEGEASHGDATLLGVAEKPLQPLVHGSRSFASQDKAECATIASLSEHSPLNPLPPPRGMVRPRPPSSRFWKDAYPQASSIAVDPQSLEVPSCDNDAEAAPETPRLSPQISDGGEQC
eukprot:TRINITY_DN9013_c0_g2_i1.p1 TRINITY_DN9013_c0_g2~~TRINITY_DN9013_c0_g2_i1.p1  ORF type:complete len:312 (+),score=52.71 TRINITY_DN9013_c0_g2_i1:68-1003(+)